MTLRGHKQQSRRGGGALHPAPAGLPAGPRRYPYPCL